MRSLLLSLALIAGCSDDVQPAAIDAATIIDMPPTDPCAQCTANQMCLQLFGGVCTTTVACVPLDPECPGGVSTPCSNTCETRYCGSPYQCQNRVSCGTESPTAFTCYGP